MARIHFPPPATHTNPDHSDRSGAGRRGARETEECRWIGGNADDDHSQRNPPPAPPSSLPSGGLAGRDLLTSANTGFGMRDQEGRQIGGGGDLRRSAPQRARRVESRCGAVAVGLEHICSRPSHGAIRSRGFVSSFSPFVSDPKSEPSVIRARFTGARINLTYGRRSSAVVPISRLRAGKGSRGRDQSFVRPF